MILELELLSDVALTATSATVDAHETLTYIPGQCLLGAAASALYAKAHDEGIAWELFHSGAVRYGCALPVNARGEVAWPMPLSLQRPKGAEAVAKDGRLTDVVVNLAHPDARDLKVQYARVGEGYLDARGAVVRPETALSMRTAIGAQGRVRDGFLFTLSAMARGTRLVAEVASDDPAHLARLRPVFDGATLRVGRSRNAEFGAVKVTVKDGTSRETMPAPREYHPATSLTFWCLTDVCLRDPATDQPTLVPAREHFGLPEGWRYDPAGSFVQNRRYSPFNAKRRRPDLERQVLTAGSVIVFEGPSALTEAAWREVEAIVARDVGEYRAEGLGRVAFEPKLLSGVRPVFDSTSVTISESDAPTVAAPAGALMRWISAQADARAARDAAWGHAKTLLDALSKRGGWRLPASQWGEVRRFARVRRDMDAKTLGAALGAFLGGERGVRAMSERWGAEHRGVTLKAWLVESVGAISLAAPGPSLALELVAVHAVRQQRREIEGGAR